MWGKVCRGEDKKGSIKELQITLERGELHQTRRSTSFECEHVYLLKTALSFLASMVSRMVSLPAPVVMVSLVTVSLVAGSVLPSSSSLSELLEEELSDATSGAFLATHTLHTHAAEIDKEEII